MGLSSALDCSIAGNLESLLANSTEPFTPLSINISINVVSYGKYPYNHTTVVWSYIE